MCRSSSSEVILYTTPSLYRSFSIWVRLAGLLVYRFFCIQVASSVQVLLYNCRSFSTQTLLYASPPLYRSFSIHALFCLLRSSSLWVLLYTVPFLHRSSSVQVLLCTGSSLYKSFSVQVLLNVDLSDLFSM